MGCLIALEGIDKSGKGTQAKLIKKWLASLGYDVEIISFPDYSTPIGREIKAFLSGERTFSSYVRQLLYAANRWERKDDIEKWLSLGKIVIADRYTPSGLAYGLANNLPLKWMLCLEDGLPKANIVIVIDISVNEALSRIKHSQDVYERDIHFLKRVRESYLRLARKFNWYVVNGEQEVQEVFNDIKCILFNFLVKKTNKKYYSPL